MTKVICSTTRCDGNLYFECKGHSEYKNPQNGNNDLCVAVSTLCAMLVRYIVSEGHEPECCEDGHVKISINESNLKMNEVFKAVMLEFSGLASEYPEHIRVY